MTRPGSLPRLHAVTDERIARLPDLAERARTLTGAGPIALHARGAALSGREHLDLARLFARSAPGRLFVNDRLDVALAAGGSVAGVQLSRRGLTPRDARRLSPNWWIGASVHTPSEGAAARDEGADYLLVGPVFATLTHPEQPPLGVAGIAPFLDLGLPVVVIGGVSPANVRAVKAAGAYGVAAIRALWDAVDPAQAARELMNKME